MSDVETAAVADGAKIVREQSTVQFPYADMDEALRVARQIHLSGGIPLDRDQLAVGMGHKPTSGSFGQKLSAAKMFGFIETTSGGKIQISDLGHEALSTDVAQQRAAKASAFMNVELYRMAFDEFRGRVLPPRPDGLEKALVGLGVALKQGTNARYAFDRSARQAGFYDHGNTRLIAPLAAPSSPAGEVPESPAPIPPAPVQDQPQHDPVISALIRKLPAASVWPTADRVVWLTMMSMAFDLAYGRDGEITIAGKAKPAAASPPAPAEFE